MISNMYLSMNTGCHYFPPQITIATLIIGLFVISTLVKPVILEGTSSNLSVYSIDSKPYGLSYGEWTAKWWQWIYSIPETDNPGNDETGEKCAVGQNDPDVWMLVGTPGGKVSRTCSVPEGKAILFPIINVECDYIVDRNLKTESDLRKCAKTDQDKAINLLVTVDGAAIPNLQMYRMQSPLFNLTYPEDNIAGLPAGSTYAISDGYWILLKPLPLGKHEIRFSGSLVDFTATGPVNFVTDAKYDLTIINPKVK